MLPATNAREILVIVVPNDACPLAVYGYLNRWIVQRLRILHVIQVGIASSLALTLSANARSAATLGPLTATSMGVERPGSSPGSSNQPVQSEKLTFGISAANR